MTVTRIRCVSPANVAGSYAVEVTNNNNDYTSNAISFLYQAGASVSGVTPLLGSVAGGTNVTVTGANFVGATVYCKISSTVVVAVKGTASMVYCVSPALAAGSYNVEVSNNNQDFTNNGVQFQYVAAASVTSVLPTSGPVGGASMVTVTGTNFFASSGLVCRFGTASGIAATWVTASLLQCLSPATAAGAVALEISNNNKDYTSNSVQFTFRPRHP